MSIAISKRSIMTLFTDDLDPYSHRVRIVLAEKGVAFECVEVKPDKFPEELAEINPYCSVPTLIDRELVLYKSEIIMEYLDERFPHPPLMPVYPVARGRSRLIWYRINRDWYTLMHKIMDAKTDPLTREQSKKDLLDNILTINPIFHEMPFFMSEEFSLVDCSIAPLLWRLQSLGITIPETATGILMYQKRIFERESFVASLTTAELALGS